LDKIMELNFELLEKYNFLSKEIEKFRGFL